MDTYRLKMKLGENEFESEGPPEIVQAQFAAFREMVELLAKAQPASRSPLIEIIDNSTTAKPAGKSEVALEKIMRTEGRVVSLTVRGAGLDDEIMLVMLGQRSLRKNDSVSGAEIMDGLRLTGRQVTRIDYQLDKMTEAGDVITVGTGRARRYRFTNQGFAKAQELALDLASTVA